jgi:hypothetical protein
MSLSNLANQAKCLLNLVNRVRSNLNLRRDQLTMSYFDNFDNGPLNKYKKILKIEKKIYKCILLL